MHHIATHALTHSHTSVRPVMNRHRRHRRRLRRRQRCVVICLNYTHRRRRRRKNLRPPAAHTHTNRRLTTNHFSSNWRAGSTYSFVCGVFSSTPSLCVCSTDHFAVSITINSATSFRPNSFSNAPNDAPGTSQTFGQTTTNHPRAPHELKLSAHTHALHTHTNAPSLASTRSESSL